MQASLFDPQPVWALAALAALGRHRFLSAPQLAFSLQRPLGEIDEGMERLVGAQLVATLETPATSVARRVRAYALSRRGAALLAASTGSAPMNAPTLSRSVYLLAHQLAVADVGLTLEALDERGELRLRRWETVPERLAQVAHVVERGAVVRVPLVADALAVVEDARGLQAVLVEVDRGTVSVARMRRKYEGYLSWWRAGGHRAHLGIEPVRVLTVAPTTRRLERLEGLGLELNDGRGTGLLWFALHESIGPETSVQIPACHVASERVRAPVALFDARPGRRALRAA